MDPATVLAEEQGEPQVHVQQAHLAVEEGVEEEEAENWNQSEGKSKKRREP